VLIFLFAMLKVVGADISSVIEYAPTILGPLLILAVYLLACELTSVTKNL
jgi:asparagine N-glycosylation enzyme membrane subunit Stt3